MYNHDQNQTTCDFHHQLLEQIYILLNKRTVKMYNKHVINSN